MAHAIASMAAPGLVDAALPPRSICVTRVGSIRAQQQDSEPTRRSMLGLVAAGLTAGTFAKSASAGGTSIKIGPVPPLSGGLPGTLNADEPRDLDLPYKSRFFIQGLPPVQAAARAIDSAKDILGVKTFIDKKAWPYVQMDLRNKAGVLRYDINTVIEAKSKEEKAALKELTGKLFQTISKLDRAAKDKNSSQAEKYYAETVSSLNDVLAKLG